MSLNIHRRPHGKVEIIDISGKLTLGDGTVGLREAVLKTIAGGSDALLNLSGVSYIDSAGMGQLVDCYSQAMAAGLKVKLLNPHKRVDSLLHITKLNSTFEIFADETTALASFAN